MDKKGEYAAMGSSSTDDTVGSDEAIILLLLVVSPQPGRLRVFLSFLFFPPFFPFIAVKS